MLIGPQPSLLREIAQIRKGTRTAIISPQADDNHIKARMVVGNRFGKAMAAKIARGRCRADWEEGTDNELALGLSRWRRLGFREWITQVDATGPS
jgi:hypothetical protein